MQTRLINLFILLTFASNLFGQSCPLGALADRDVAAGWGFSEGLALYQDRLAVGAPSAPAPTLGSTSTGLVRLYQRDGRNFFLETEIGYPGTDFDPDFGVAIALHDSLLVVGAPKEDVLGAFDDEGSVFVYELIGETWSLVAILSASDPQEDSGFGDDVASDGTTIVVGAKDLPSNSSQGGAYVFTKTNGIWAETQKLLPSDPSNQAKFGTSIHVEGSEILVGAPGSKALDGSSLVGAVYRFQDDGTSYREVQILVGSVTDSADDFGKAFDVFGDRMIVGAPRWGPGISSQQGAIFAFSFDGANWVETEFIISPANSTFESFGTSLGVDGSVAAIGATGGDTLGIDNVGLIYLYRLGPSGTWDFEASLSADSPTIGADYGMDVELDSGILAGGTSKETSSCLELGGRVELTSVSGAVCRSLTGFPKFHSLAVGGTTILTLDAGVEHAGESYFLGGSLSGTNPGTIVGGTRIPLNADVWFQFAILNANAGIWTANSGVLDSNGRAVALLSLPPIDLPILSGLVLDHAFVAFASNGTISDVSNPAILCLLP